jgi:hypothetical protein
MHTGAGFLAIGLLAVAYQAAGDIPSGPDAGATAEPVRVGVAAGERLGQSFDAVADRAGRPAVFLFVPADRFDRPTARFLKTLDDALARGIEGAADASALAIWLTDTPEQAREYLPRAQQSLQLARTTWGVFDGAKLGPPGWSINDTANLTAVVVRGGKVVASFGYQAPGEGDVREVLRALRETHP